MKFFLLSLLLHSGSACYAQHSEDIFHRLIEHGLIDSIETANIKKLLEKFKESKKPITNAVVAYTLITTEQGKLRIDNRPDNNHYFNMDTNSTLRDTLLSISNELHNLGIIDSMLLIQTSKRINTWELKDPLLIYQFVFTRLVFNESLQWKQLRRQVQPLLELNIIDSAGFIGLRSRSDANLLVDHYDIINLCKWAKIIQLPLSNNPKEYLEYVHRETAKILPQLDFSDFSFEILPDETHSNEEYKFYNVHVQLNANGKQYSHKSNINPERKPGAFKGMISDYEYYKIFNEILAENKSPYRIHNISNAFFTPEAQSDYSKIVLIALTQTQEKALNEQGSILDHIGNENYGTIEKDK